MSKDTSWERSMRHVQTTNQRMMQMKALGGTGSVRTVGLNAKLFAGYQKAMVSTKAKLAGKITGPREKFNTLRKEMGNIKSLKLSGRAIHHFKFPITKYVNKAMNPGNLQVTSKGALRAGSFKPAHIQLHQIFGGKNIFSKMSWGKQNAMQRHFSFMNRADRVPLNKAANQTNGVIASKIKAFNAQQAKLKGSGVASKISNAIKNSPAVKGAAGGIKSAISGAIKLSGAGKLGGAAKASGVGKASGGGAGKGIGGGGKGSGMGKPPGGGMH